MGIKSFLNSKLITILESRVRGSYKLENSLTEKDGVLKASSIAPERFDIPLEGIKFWRKGGKMRLADRKIFPILLSDNRIIQKSFKDLKKNLIDPQKHISMNDLQEFENYAKSIGITAIGYTKVKPEYIFKDKAITFDNAIVLLMEMDKEDIMKAPHRDTLIMVMKTYNTLGKITDKLTTYLRANNYAAQAVHPRGGTILTPPLAVDANLGWIGRHGMLISEVFGPRVRISAILTNIENLPFAEDNKYSWISNYCKSCGICIKKCPVEAIKEVPVVNDNNTVTHIDVEKCFPYFIEYYGCSVCIKVCPFNKIGYSRVKEKFNDKIS